MNDASILEYVVENVAKAWRSVCKPTPRGFNISCVKNSSYRLSYMLRTILEAKNGRRAPEHLVETARAVVLH